MAGHDAGLRAAVHACVTVTAPKMPTWLCTIDHAAGNRMTSLFNFDLADATQCWGWPCT